jgi:uncharacterized protein with von Willebrand factor type A (vWA) domain
MGLSKDGLVTQYRYRVWDGTQPIEPFTPEDAMDFLAGEILDGGDVRSALNRLMRQGANMRDGRRMPGMRELLDRLRARREQDLQRYNLDSVMDEISERLDAVIEKERSTVADRLREAEQPTPPDAATDGDVASDQQLRDMLRNIARQRSDQLNTLPGDPGGRIQQLRDYDFMDPDARHDFEELLQMLQKQVIEQYFQGIQQAIESMTPEDMRQAQQMIHDLNELLKQRLRGELPDFEDFMERWGHMFPPGIESLDDLLDYLEQQNAQMQSLLNSMDPHMRGQLEHMMQALLQDHRIQLDLLEMASLMQQLRPRSSGGDFDFFGDEPLSMQEALRLMGELNDVDSLEQELRHAAEMNDVSQLDLDEIARLLGEDAKQIAQQLQQLAQTLEDAGLLRHKGREWELTPRAVRRIGERALRDIFGTVEASTTGEHTLSKRGFGLEPADETKQYTWGDPFGLVDTNRTVLNAVLREGPPAPVHMQPDDFEVHPTYALAQCSTVIMLDMSYSMMHGGRFQAGRRIALALDTLIRSKFPRDHLEVVAFSYFVRALKPSMLLDSYWVQYGGGTNFQQALAQARKMLTRTRGGTRQIIFITDGEPTTYSYWSGAEPAGGPTPGGGFRRLPGVLQETLREVVRCTKEDITINTFILDSSPHVGDFLRTMAKINRGRAFFGSAQELGKYILLDYVNNKRARIA